MGILTFFRKLAADPAANTIVIAAVALIPLLGMVGGAVDASRFYMTSSRLQAACDAGALAARRSMADDTFATEDKEVGLNFFDQNYQPGQFGLEGLQRDYVSDDEGEVQGSASGTLPTSLMHIFGYEQFEIAVTCTADINISNTDITFVLDVTGSMAWQPNGTQCGTLNGLFVECTESRIGGLRSAVLTFYDTVEDATSDSAQVRYGVVPYANNVNVGAALMAENPAWMAQSHTYQSREANITVVPGEFRTVSQTILGITVTSKATSSTQQRQTVFLSSSSACSALKPADRVDFNDSLGQFNQESQVVSGNTRTTIYNDTNENILIYEGFTSYRSSDGRCRYGWNVFAGTGDARWQLVEQKDPDQETFQNWTYRPVTFDLSSLYNDNLISLPIGANGTMTDVRWDGCVEEANTVSDETFDPVPSGANDLDINLVPDDPSEFWKPVLGNAVYLRTDSAGNRTLNELTQTADESRPFYGCPTAAFRLTEIDRDDLETYVNGLRANGATYHDLGMIWGARFASPRGIFADDNATAPNGDAIARHIVFMTDGELAPNTDIYSTYGIEWWDRRVTDDGGFDQAFARHGERFQAACRAARQENISVWVIAFGTALTQNLIDCATPGRTYAAEDTEELEAAFTEIAQKIAALRLTK